MKNNQLLFLFLSIEIIYFSQIFSQSLLVGLFMSLACLYLKNKQPKISILLLLSIIIGYNDVYFDGTNQISSFYAYDFLGLTLPVIVIACYFFPEIFKDIFFNHSFKIYRNDGVLFWYMILGAIGLFSSIFSETNIRIFISDLSFIAIPFMVVYSLRSYKNLNSTFLLYALLYTILFKLLVDSQNYFFQIGVVIGDERNFFFDSVGNLSPVAALLGFYLFIEKQNKVGGILAMILGIFATTNSSSRGTLILGLLSLIFYLSLFYKIKKIKIFSKRNFPVLFVLLLFTITIFFSAGDFYFWKISTIMPSENFSVLDRDFQSSTVRLLELININAYLYDNKLLLNGVGFGGYFNDNYFPFSHLLFDTTTYNDSWIINNTLYKPHLVALFFYLKTGIVGIIIWLIIFYKITIGAAYKIIKNSFYQEEAFFRSLSSCLALLMYFKSFNSKLQFILGILLYIIINNIVFKDE